MYVILYRNKFNVKPSDTWNVMNEALYFDRKQAWSDCNTLNEHSSNFEYQVYQLKKSSE